MTNSRNATSPKAWRKRTGGVELELPSGNICRVKRPGMDKLLKAGLMPDSLTPIIMQHLRDAESGGRPQPEEQDDKDVEREIMEKVLQDPSEMEDMFRSFDNVVAMCVVEPKVELHFREVLDDNGANVLDDKGRKTYEDIAEEDRKSSDWPEDHPNYVTEEFDVIYTDDVDQDDKQFIFQYVVGGSSDLESFRTESATALEDA